MHVAQQPGEVVGQHQNDSCCSPPGRHRRIALASPEVSPNTSSRHDGSSRGDDVAVDGASEQQFTEEVPWSTGAVRIDQIAQPRQLRKRTPPGRIRTRRCRPWQIWILSDLELSPFEDLIGDARRSKADDSSCAERRSVPTLVRVDRARM